MRFSVRHETVYLYSAPVRLGDHLLRLTPQPHSIGALSHAIETDPAPAWRRDEVDGYGTPVTRLGFAGETTLLRIVSRFEGETQARTADFPDMPDLPWREVPMAAWLGSGEAPSVEAFARDIAAESGWQAGPFLDRLAAALFERTDRHIRPGGNARDAAETLRLGSGACRDLTILFMAACRSLGIPARFVSGYQAYPDVDDGRRHMHAWPEAWLPGAGWRGYDPTHGTAVTDTHVALAAAPDQAATMPVEGGFWGTGVTSTLDYRVEIDAG
ncbi:MAG: transglutaminase family protein [Brucellaceae bacterium]|nr:transglutaminase family protein [Brucellaceae bacterium]